MFLAETSEVSSGGEEEAVQCSRLSIVKIVR